MTAFDAEAFVERAPWRFARTMPHIPHWYVVRGKDVPEQEFDAFVAHIRERGYRARWGRRVNTYLDLGEWKYWALPGKGEPDDAPVIIVNREHLRPAVHNPVSTEDTETAANDEPLPRAETAG